MKFFHRILTTATLAALASPLFAVMTESIVHEGFSRFDKGEFKNMGISVDGKLFPTRTLTELSTVPAAIIWQAVVTPDGDLILSTGNNGTVYRVVEGEAPKVIFQPEESLSRALAVDAQGRIYVGTSPKGRVYRLLPDGTQEIFFDPADLYIWDIQIGPDNMVYVATGGKGKVYQIAQSYRPGDEVRTFFEASETHVNKIAFTPDGEGLIIGCGSGGNLYRLDLDGNYFALYHTGAEEIKAIYPQPDGSVFFSTFSSKASGSPSSSSAPGNARPASGGGDEEEAGNPFMMTIFARSNPEENGLLLLDANGSLRTVWSLNPNKIFSVFQQEDGQWMIGSGTNGRVFLADGLNRWSNVLAVPTGGEVTQILRKRDTGEDLYLISSNPARVYKLEAEMSEEAQYTSEVMDTGKMVQWGAVRYLSTTGSFVNGVEVETRTGNIQDPNRSWSEWVALDGDRIQSPNARFIQYRLRIQPDHPGLQRVQVYFQEQNLYPTVDEIRVLPGAYGLFAPPRQTQNPTFPKIFQSRDGVTLSPRIPQLVKEKEEGAMTAVWMPGDPNRDRLLFDLYLRRVGDVNWINIATDLDVPLFAMDIRGLEEGYYQLQVVADDRLDNTPEKALRFEKLSDPFLVDFTSPLVTLESVAVENGTFRATVVVKDKFGVIERAFYVLNGGHMFKAMPLDGLFDSSEERFELVFDQLRPGTYSLVFQGYDENGNVGVMTHSFQVP
jgi:outer membrane protein assembly factor BamB